MLVLCLVIVLMAIAATVCLAGEAAKSESSAPFSDAAKNVNDLWSMVVKVPLTIIIGFLLYSIGRELMHGSVVMEPIAVPADLTALGYTPQAVAERIRTEIRALQLGSRTRSGVEEAFELSTALVDFAVPTSGFTFRSAIQYARQVLNLPDERITGEIVKEDAGGKTRLHIVLRMRNGRTASAHSVGASEMQIAKMLESAAYELAAIADPYSLASYWFTREQSGQTFEKTLDMIRRCLSTTPAKKHHGAYLLWGNVLTLQRKFDEAEAKYRMAASLAPRRSAVFVGWGAMLRQKRQIDAAAKKYRSALWLKPVDASAWHNLGNVCADQHSYRAAACCFALSVFFDRRRANAFSGWGNALMRMGRYAEAEEKLLRGIDVDPAAGWPHINLARLRRLQRRFDEAIETLSIAAQNEPVTVDALLTWGDVLVDQERFDEAMEKYMAADALNPLLANRDSAAALVHFRRREYEQAISSAEKSLARYRYNIPARHHRMNAFRQLGLDRECLRAAGELLVLDKYQWWAYTVSASVLLKQHRYEAAIATCRRGAGDTAETWALRTWAHALRSMKQPEKALAIYRQARERNPYDANAAAEESRTLLSIGRRAQALHLARQACAVNPSDGTALRALSDALIRGRDAAGAAEDLEAIVAANPPHARRLAEYGHVLAMLPRRRDHARHAYKSALAIDRRSLNALLGLAELEWKARRFRQALRYARAAFDVEPWESWTQRFLGELLFAAGRYTFGKRWYATCAERWPHDVELLASWGDQLRKVEELDEAEKKYCASIDRDRYFSRGYLGLALVHGRREEWREAKRRLRQATGIDPYNTRIWKTWIETLEKQFDYRAAARVAGRAFAATRDDDFELQRARLFLDMGRLRDALTMIERLRVRDRDLPGAWQLHVDCLTELGRTAEALLELDAVSTLDGKQSLDAADRYRRLERYDSAEARYDRAAHDRDAAGRALVGLASVQHARGRSREAASLLERALELNPSDRRAHFDLAALRADRRAVTAWKVVVDKKETSPELLRDYGRLLLETGNPGAALHYFERVTELNRWDWAAWTYRAWALNEQGQTEQARLALRNAKRIRPHNAVVARTAQRLSKNRHRPIACE